MSIALISACMNDMMKLMLAMVLSKPVNCLRSLAVFDCSSVIVLAKPAMSSPTPLILVARPRVFQLCRCASVKCDLMLLNVISASGRMVHSWLTMSVLHVGIVQNLSIVQVSIFVS